MAKESMKARERKRERMVARDVSKRAALTTILKSTSSEDEAVQDAKWDAMMAIQKLPANGSKVRLHNRCGLTGRPRGYMRQFGISRVTFREMALGW
jgi:small subunit ribosomal protein S14